MGMKFIDWLDDYADKSIRFIDDHSWWFFGIGSVLAYFSIVIPVTLSSGFSLLFVSAMLLAAPMIGWPLMLVYMLPFGLIQLFCYCVRNPLTAFATFLKFILCCVALFLLGMCIHVL